MRGALIAGTAAVVVTILITGVGGGEECSSSISVTRCAGLNPCDAIGWFEGFAIGFLLLAVVALVVRTRRQPVHLWQVALVLVISIAVYVVPMASMDFI